MLRTNEQNEQRLLRFELRTMDPGVEYGNSGEPRVVGIVYDPSRVSADQNQRFRHTYGISEESYFKMSVPFNSPENPIQAATSWGNGERIPLFYSESQDIVGFTTSESHAKGILEKLRPSVEKEAA